MGGRLDRATNCCKGLFGRSESPTTFVEPTTSGTHQLLDGYRRLSNLYLDNLLRLIKIHLDSGEIFEPAKDFQLKMNVDSFPHNPIYELHVFSTDQSYRDSPTVCLFANSSIVEVVRFTMDEIFMRKLQRLDRMTRHPK